MTRPDRTAQIAYLNLMWCGWLNISWDDLDAGQRCDVMSLSRRVVDCDLPELGRAFYGVPRPPEAGRVVRGGGAA